jgi:AraC-like DNA-binding protein
MVEAGQGDLITCNPGEVHDGAPIGGARTWRMLYLPPRIATELVADIRERPSDDFEFTNPVFNGRTRVRDFNAAYAALTRHVEVEFAQEPLIVLLSALVRTKPAAGVLPHAALARAKARIDDDPTSTITLADLALQTQLSRFQLIRGFSKLTGLTLHAYIVQRRLERARAMIAKGTALTDVAVACGFADQSHLNRTFVRRYGMTPGAYACAWLRRA